ncbi:Endonuclease/exonuclease/phosphatase family protein [hydrothermal vent metagenome]|uniref:Endonuclease/exonuclease/phosphatase family protein n=1 Tax=hydrothermal vent metagenome TaxID=652676 RepID=A0A1W1CZZ3_9ZZZZ
MKIRLATFNLLQFTEPPYAWYSKKDKFTAEEWLEKTAWIKNQVLQIDCDIIGFQEVFSRKALRALVKECGFKYFKVVDIPRVSKKHKMTYITTTVAIASKYPIIDVEEVEIKEVKFSRNPIKARIKLENDKELLVYVAHLKSNRLNEFEYVFNKEHDLKHKKSLVYKALKEKNSESLKQRLAEASALFEDIAKSRDISSVLLCDLNDKEFSITIEALSNPKYYNSLSQEEPILYDASYYYEEEVYNPHPEAKEAKRKPTSYFMGKGNVLDYIFISKDLREKVRYYTLFDAHLEENKDGSLLTSDHAQVLCELDLDSINKDKI